MLYLAIALAIVAIAGRVVVRRIDARDRLEAMRRHPSYRAAGVDPFADHRPGCGCSWHR